VLQDDEVKKKKKQVVQELRSKVYDLDIGFLY
jgi:hypothetical protein